MADEEKKVVPELEDPGKPVDVSERVEAAQEPTDNFEVANPAESKQDVSDAENADEEKKDVPEDEDPDVAKGVSPKVRKRIRQDKRKLTAQQKRRERLREIEQEIAKLQEENHQIAAELSQNRTQCRNSCVFTMYNMILKEFDLMKKEKAACTEDEFDALLKEVKAIMDAWKDGINKLKYDCMIPGFKKVCEQLGLKDELAACKTKEDYREIYKKVNKRLKELLNA